MKYDGLISTNKKLIMKKMMTLQKFMSKSDGSKWHNCALIFIAVLIPTPKAITSYDFKPFFFPQHI